MVVVFFNKFICFLLCKFLLMWVNGIGYDFVIFVVCVYFYLFVNWFYYFFFIGKFLSLFFFNLKKFYLNIYYWLKYDYISILIVNY